jgi:hypothetical protein
MFGRKLRNRPTHWVVRKLVLLQSEVEAREEATIWQPWDWATRSWATDYETQARELIHELAVRYRGVMTEAFSMNGITSTGDVQNALDATWRSFYADMYRVAKPEEFSCELWRAVQRTSGTPEPRLKSKFMLRQFVEDVPKRKGRDTLRRLGFERERGAPPAATQDLRVLERAYPALHRALLAWGSRLNAITCGEFLFTTVSLFEPPYAVYEGWLFE